MLIVSLTKSGPNDLYSVTRIVFSFSVNYRKMLQNNLCIHPHVEMLQLPTIQVQRTGTGHSLGKY